MTWLLRYWKAFAAVALIALAYGWGYHTRGLAASYAMASHLAQDLKAQQSAARIADKQREQADEALRIAQQAIPRTRDKVADEIRKHPTSPLCVVPDDVLRRLHEGIVAGEASTSG